MAELDKWGLSILPPDIRRSRSSWYGDREANGVRYGIASIAGLSNDDMPMIDEVRNRLALDMSIDNNVAYFMEFMLTMEVVSLETGMKKLNKTKMVNLIKSGAFDLGEEPFLRLELLNMYKTFNKSVDTDFKMTKAVIYEWERDLMGRTISMRSRWELLADEASTQFTGTLTEVREFTSNKGNTMARGKIENATDEISFLVFPSVWTEWKEHFTEGTRWTLFGKKDGDTIVSGRATPASEEIMTEKLQREGALTPPSEKNFMDSEIMLDW